MKIEALKTELLKEIPQVTLDAGKILQGKSIDPKKLEAILEKAKLDKEEILGEQDTLDPQKLEDYVDALNKFLLAFDQQFKFRVYKDTNSIWVRILDAKTEQVLREIPSRQALELASKIRDFIGLLFDERA